jgi:uncharacterized protein (TIGR02594 family)
MKLYDLAQRFVGMAELAGDKHNGFISWAHSLCGLDPSTPDEVPWCSSFVNALAWMLRLPRSKSSAARSWLNVGRPIEIDLAVPGFDVVILKRGTGPQPGPEITSGAPGHVGLFAGIDQSVVLVLGGNQSNSVNIARYPINSMLGVRRLS